MEVGGSNPGRDTVFYTLIYFLSLYFDCSHILTDQQSIIIIFLVISHNVSDCITSPNVLKVTWGENHIHSVVLSQRVCYATTTWCYIVNFVFQGFTVFTIYDRISTLCNLRGLEGGPIHPGFLENLEGTTETDLVINICSCALLHNYLYSSKIFLQLCKANNKSLEFHKSV